MKYIILVALLIFVITGYGSFFFLCHGSKEKIAIACAGAFSSLIKKTAFMIQTIYQVL